jgi:hypothetical protein
MSRWRVVWREVWDRERELEVEGGPKEAWEALEGMLVEEGETAAEGVEGEVGERRVVVEFTPVWVGLADGAEEEVEGC